MSTDSSGSHSPVTALDYTRTGARLRAARVPRYAMIPRTVFSFPNPEVTMRIGSRTRLVEHSSSGG